MTLPATSWLFYVRLSAIYLHDKKAMVCFGIAWLAVFAYFLYDGALFVFRFVSTGILEPEKVDGWAFILNLLYDTMVYLAISWRLAAFSIKGDSWKHRVRSFVAGEGLLGLSKALLRGGQMYYW